MNFDLDDEDLLDDIDTQVSSNWPDSLQLLLVHVLICTQDINLDADDDDLLQGDW